MSTPPLSVIVVSFNGARRLRACLASLVPQARALGAEVLVSRNWGEDAPAGDRLAEAFPEVQWLDAAEKTTVPALRFRGIEASHGEVVGLLEDDCEAASDWCRAAIAAHNSDAVAVGGAVEPGPYTRGLDWAVYFCEYGRYMLPLSGGPAVDLPGNNVTYKRGALATLPKSAASFYDVFVHQRWAKEGRLIQSNATLVVRNMNFWTARHVLSVPFHHGRTFGAQRSVNWPPPLRLAAGVLAPFLPLLAMARIMRNTVRQRRYVGRLFQALPGILLFTGSWSLGEATGYLAGPGDSPARWR